MLSSTIFITLKQFNLLLSTKSINHCYIFSVSYYIVLYTFSAVSYTHLDVYKRQGLAYSSLARWRGCLLCLRACMELFQLPGVLAKLTPWDMLLHQPGYNNSEEESSEEAKIPSPRIF